MVQLNDLQIVKTKRSDNKCLRSRTALSLFTSQQQNSTWWLGQYRQNHLQFFNLSTLHNNLVVVNYSDHPLNEDQQSVLAKGGSLAVVPNKLPIEDIVAIIESSSEIYNLQTP